MDWQTFYRFENAGMTDIWTELFEFARTEDGNYDFHVWNYNKGALQYLPSAGLSDEPYSASTRRKPRPRNEGLKCNYAVHTILGHHHGLVLVESSDLAATEDR